MTQHQDLTTIHAMPARMLACGFRLLALREVHAEAAPAAFAVIDQRLLRRPERSNRHAIFFALTFRPEIMAWLGEHLGRAAVHDAAGRHADEVQNIRPFGEETGQETVLGKVAERLRDTHLPAHAATEELARLGAVKGVVTYADSSTLDLFSEFGVSQEAEIDFDLDNATPASGALRGKCQSTIRTMSDAWRNQLPLHPRALRRYLL